MLSEAIGLVRLSLSELWAIKLSTTFYSCLPMSSLNTFLRSWVSNMQGHWLQPVVIRGHGRVMLSRHGKSNSLKLLTSLYFLLQIQIFRFRGTDEKALSSELIFSSSGWSVSLLKAVSLSGCCGISRDQDQLPNQLYQYQCGPWRYDLIMLRVPFLDANMC